MPLKLLFTKVFGKVPLRNILIVPFLVQIVGTVGLVGYLSFRSGQKAVEDLIIELGQEVGARIEQKVLSFLEQSHRPIQTLLLVTQNAHLNLNNFQQLQCFFLTQIQQSNSLNHLGFGNEKGELISVERSPSAIDSEFVVKVKDESTGSQRIAYRIDRQCNRTKLLKKKKYDPRVAIGTKLLWRRKNRLGVHFIARFSPSKLRLVLLHQFTLKQANYWGFSIANLHFRPSLISSKT